MTDTSRCAKCGACTVVCPIWRVTGREEHTARGKLHLLDRLDPATASEAYAAILSKCLLCGACSAACSRNLDPTERLLAARTHLNRKAGSRLLLRGIAQQLLASPNLLALLTSIGQPLLRRLPPESGMRLRLGLGPSSPPAATQPKPQPASHADAGAACFLGCYATHLRPEIAGAVSRVISRATALPTLAAPGQCCCGLAAESSGDRDTAIRLAKQNIASFAEQQLPIVVACASCHHQLMRYPQLLADEPGWRERAKAFAGRLVEFSAFAAHNLSILAPTSQADQRTVICHDPCHLRFPHPATAPQREVVRALPGCRLAEMPDGPQCCGHGGLFQLAHPELSAIIRGHLIDQLQQSNAQLVTTTCSGCLIQLGMGLNGHNGAPQPIHLALLLAEHL